MTDNKTELTYAVYSRNLGTDKEGPYFKNERIEHFNSLQGAIDFIEDKNLWEANIKRVTFELIPFKRKLKVVLENHNERS